MPLKHSYDLDDPGAEKPSKPPGGSASRFTVGSSRMRSDLDQVEEEGNKKEHDVVNEKEVDKKPLQLAPAVYLEEEPNNKDCHEDDPPPSATENVNKEEDKKPLQLAPAVYLEQEPNNKDCHDDDPPPSATKNVNKEEDKKPLQLAPAVYLEEDTNNENCHDDGIPSANDTENAAATTDRRRRGLRPHSSFGELTSSAESIDHPPGAFPIRGMGRSGRGALSIDEEATILYSMGAPNGFTNDGAVGASDNDDCIMYPQEKKTATQHLFLTWSKILLVFLLLPSSPKIWNKNSHSACNKNLKNVWMKNGGSNQLLKQSK